MTISEMKEKKQQLGYSCEKISELSGVPLGTVQKIFSGITKTPRYETLRQLEIIFQEAIYYEDMLHDQTEFPMMRETQLPYQGGRKQGEYTIEDYYVIPEEKRAELIDGVIYDMGAPTTIHQQISFEIGLQLREYIRKKHGSCMVFIAPTDVQLDCDEKTMVQPDVFVVCNREKLLRRCIYGAPDLAVEVLSPSTRKKDMSLKYGKYAGAGVRECWLVDPDKQKIMVYDLEKEEFPVIYGFDDCVPVHIFEGECEVDFTWIYEELRFLYQKEE